MINPKGTTVGEILSLAAQFVVPKYQRGYAWGRSEADEFFEDLVSESESGRGLFMGTLIFDTSHEHEKKYTIVDGQQRLTTIMLLLIACRSLAKSLNAPEIAAIIQQRLTFVDPSTAKSLGPILLPSTSIKDVFERIADSEWDGVIPTRLDKNRPVKRQANLIRPVLETFTNSIKQKDRSELSKLLESIYRCRVIRIDIHGEEEAFTIFERTNARGTDLEISDLLKNYLYQQKVESLDDKWPEIIRNSDGTIIRMLKYFYVSKKGYVSKSDLYRRLKDYCKEIGGADAFVEQLSEFSRYYSLVRSEDSADAIKKYFLKLEAKEIAEHQERYEQIHIALQGLRLFKVSQIYPLLYSAISCFVRSGGGKSRTHAKLLIRLIQDLEKYHFINNAICNRVGNEVEKLYANFCESYEASTDFIATTTDVGNALRMQLAKEDEFTTRFCDITYSSDSIPLIAYIFDRMSNFGVAPGERVSIFSPGRHRTNHNIEHFYPQKPGKDMEEDPDTADLVDNIGNLLAISFRANSSLGNLSPQKKAEKLNGDLLRKVQNLQYVREFLKRYEKAIPTWGRTAIFQRAHDLAQTAYRETWRIDHYAASASAGK